ncbi:PIN domain-containing protein [Breznakiellaceae bacterium SP9]
MKIYLDNCAYNRPYDDQTQIRIAIEAQAKLHIQRLVIEKKLDLVVSYISRFENNANPYASKRNLIDSFFQNAALYIDSSHSVSVDSRAAGIMEHTIKTNDALHLSAAIEAGCDCFITTDDGILRYESKEITICSPVTFLTILEAENA